MRTKMGKEKRLASKCSTKKEKEVSFVAMIPKHTKVVNEDQVNPVFMFPPLVFGGTGNVLWSVSMETYLKALDCIWFVVVIKDTTTKKSKEDDTRAMDTILRGLSNLVRNKVGQCSLVKYI